MATRIVLTYADLVAMPSDGKRYELHEGEIYMTAAPRPRHQQVVGNLYLREHAPARLAKGAVVMHRLTKIVPGDPEVLSLDVIEVGPGATQSAWQTRTSTEWDGHSVAVVSRTGLIELKRLRGSPQDLADIALLEGHA